jgi:cephalosporin-C deacetylase-like acetyl esterase
MLFNVMKPVLAALLFVSVTLPTRAQTGVQWDFLSDPSVFPEIRGMLPGYLKSQAFALLDERQRAVSRIATPADLKARQQYVRERLRSYLGALPERTPLNPKVVGTLDRGDYRIEKIIVESRPGFYVTANLYLPKAAPASGRYPAILFPLGHEAGAKAHQAWQRTLAGLARRGFVCLAWDPLGQGERVQMYDEDLHGSKVQSGSTMEHTIIGSQCLLTGTHIAQYTIWDGMRALDYLLSRPEVDATRVGCTGNSGGGTLTSYLSALDDRIQAAAPSCYITSWQRMLESIGPQDAEQVFPLFLKDGLDYPDYLYAFGAKPFLMLTAIRDFFPIGGARATFAEAREVFTRVDTASRIGMFEADDGHGYNLPRREAAYRWFTSRLEGSENSQLETPLRLATEEELQCTPTGQVKTSFPGSTDVFTINRQLAEQLRPGRNLSAAEVRTRARELARYSPPAGRVRTAAYGEVKRPACRVEKLTYETEPGITIPALLFVPDGGAPRKPAVIFADGRGKAAAAAEAEDLAARGYVVLAPDLRGFGETAPNLDRRDYFFRAFGDYGSALTALLIGKTMIGMRAADVTRGVELLAARGDVDPSRIAAMGRSTAALPALFAALFDDRIARLALDGMLVSYEAVVSERMNQGIAGELLPSALKYFDLQDLIAVLAPRPVAIYNGVNPLGQEVGLSRLRREYARLPRSVEVAMRDREEQPFVPLLERFLGEAR